MTLQTTSLLNDEACQALISLAGNFITAHPESIWQDDLSSDVRIFNVQRKIPEFHPLFEQMNDAYGAAFGMPDYAFLMYNQLQFKSGNQGSGGGWHRDSYRFQAKAFCYLSDVASPNGPLQFIPCTEKPLGKLVHYLKKGSSTRYDDHEIKAVPNEVIGKAGTGFVLNTSGIHRGKPIEDGVRHACTLYAYQGSEKTLSKLRQRFDVM